MICVIHFFRGTERDSYCTKIPLSVLHVVLIFLKFLKLIKIYNL